MAARHTKKVTLSGSPGDPLTIIGNGPTRRYVFHLYTHEACSGYKVEAPLHLNPDLGCLSPDEPVVVTGTMYWRDEVMPTGRVVRFHTITKATVERTPESDSTLPPGVTGLIEQVQTLQSRVRLLEDALMQKGMTV